MNRLSIFDLFPQSLIILSGRLKLNVIISIQIIIFL